MNLRAWLKELRVLFLLFVALPVLLGSAVAYAHEPGTFSLFYCVVSVIAMMSLHAGTVILNDYFDFKSGTDVLNKERTPYSGGSGLLPENVLGPGHVLAVGFVGVSIGLFYTAPPFKLAYRGLGETMRLIATPLMVLGAFLVQVPVVSVIDLANNVEPLAIAVASSLPVAFLNTAALYIFEFPDYEADSAVGKKNLVVRLGRKNAVYLFIALGVLAYLSLLAGILSGLLPYYSALALIALPISALACNGLMKNHDRPKQMVPYLKAASDAYILAAAALIVTFLI